MVGFRLILVVFALRYLVALCDCCVAWFLGFDVFCWIDFMMVLIVLLV